MLMLIECFVLSLEKNVYKAYCISVSVSGSRTDAEPPVPELRNIFQILLEIFSFLV